ncbi:transporter associated domain-containing protein, partial [Salmonella enterica]|uniref:transporter associated domain-containing protein n=1 Tax=Salmonella enterica TaxID=28901 RepID=UPI0035265DC8
VELPDGDYATIAGLVLEALGRIPDVPGDAVEVGDYVLTVLAVEKRAIQRVRIEPRPEVDPAGAATNGA